DGDPGEQVQVAPPVGVPDVGALAADQHPLRGPESVHDRSGVTPGPRGTGVAGQHAAGRLLQVVAHACSFVAGAVVGVMAASGTTMVPLPRAVKTSSSTECGRRPSMTVARGTPPWTARMHASIFGTIPAER